jgi:hypothetical protein
MVVCTPAGHRIYTGKDLIKMSRDKTERIKREMGIK